MIRLGSSASLLFRFALLYYDICCIRSRLLDSLLSIGINPSRKTIFSYFEASYRSFERVRRKARLVISSPGPPGAYANTPGSY